MEKTPPLKISCVDKREGLVISDYKEAFIKNIGGGVHEAPPIPRLSLVLLSVLVCFAIPLCTVYIR